MAETGREKCGEEVCCSSPGGLVCVTLNPVLPTLYRGVGGGMTWKVEEEVAKVGQEEEEE